MISTKSHSIEYDLDHWKQYLIKNKDEWINDIVLSEEIEKNIIEPFCSHLGAFKNHELLTSEKDAII